MLLWGTGQKRRRIDHLDVQITFVVVISYDIVYFGWEGFKGGCLCECVCVQRGVGGSWVVNKDYRQSKTATLLLIYFLNPL